MVTGSAAGSAEQEGRKYDFCGKGCLAKFTVDPGRYGPESRTSPSETRGATAAAYTPDAPRGRQAHPGACPKRHGDRARDRCQEGRWTGPMHPRSARRAGDCPICAWPRAMTHPRDDDTELRDMCGASGSVLRCRCDRLRRDERSPASQSARVPGTRARLGGARPRDAGGALVRLAPARARGSVGAQPQPQHVHAHRARRERCIRVQRRGGNRAGRLSRVDEGCPRRGRFVLRGCRRHRRAVLLGQVLELRARYRTNAAIRELLKLALPLREGYGPPTAADEDVPVEALLTPVDRLRIRPESACPWMECLIEGTGTFDESFSRENRCRHQAPGRQAIAAR